MIKTLNFYDKNNEDIKDAIKGILKQKVSSRSKYDQILSFLDLAPADESIYEKMITIFRESIFSVKEYAALLEISFRSAIYQTLMALEIATRIQKKIDYQKRLKFFKNNAKYYLMTEERVNVQVLKIATAIQAPTSRKLSLQAGVEQSKVARQKAIDVKSTEDTKSKVTESRGVTAIPGIGFGSGDVIKTLEDVKPSEVAAVKPSLEEFGDLATFTFDPISNAWDVREVLMFLKSGGRENQGDVAALSAIGLSKYIEFRVKQNIAKEAALGVARESVYAVGERWLAVSKFGPIAAAGWTIWEMAKLGNYIGQVDREQRRQKEYGMELFRLDLWDRIWGPFFIDYLPIKLQERFDLIADDNKSHSIVPTLSRSIDQGMKIQIKKINDRWIGLIDIIKDTQKRLDEWIDTSDLYNHSNKRELQITLERIHKRIEDDIKGIEEIALDSRNWELLPEEMSVLGIEYAPEL